jgi:hypothetical protein
MTLIGQPERATQNRVLTLFRNELGYRYLKVRLLKQVIMMQSSSPGGFA